MMTMIIVSVSHTGQQKIEGTVEYQGNNLKWLFSLTNHVLFIIKNYQKEIDLESIDHQDIQVLDYQHFFYFNIKKQHHDF